eukprot:7081748-Prymnesium_polylepis.1
MTDVDPAVLLHPTFVGRDGSSSSTDPDGSSRRCWLEWIRGDPPCASSPTCPLLHRISSRPRKPQRPCTLLPVGESGSNVTPGE